VLVGAGIKRAIDGGDALKRSGMVSIVAKFDYIKIILFITVKYLF
jgi:hypothetical protein